MAKPSKTWKLVVTSIIISLIILALFTLAFIHLIAPAYNITEDMINSVLTKIFPILVGLVLIEIAILVGKKNDDDYKDTIDKLSPNAYDSALYTAPIDDPAKRGRVNGESLDYQKTIPPEIREIIKEVPVETIKEVVKEVPVEVVKEVPVEVEKQVPVEVEVVKEVVKEVPVEVIKEVPVEVVREAQSIENEKIIIKEVERPVEVIKYVPEPYEVKVPVDVIKTVEIIKEVEKPVEVIKEVPVETIKEVVKEIPVEVIKEVTVEKEVPVEVVKEETVEKEVPVEREVHAKTVDAVYDFKASLDEEIKSAKEYGYDLSLLAIKESEKNGEAELKTAFGSDVLIFSDNNKLYAILPFLSKGETDAKAKFIAHKRSTALNGRDITSDVLIKEASRL